MAKEDHIESKEKISEEKFETLQCERRSIATTTPDKYNQEVQIEIVYKRHLTSNFRSDKRSQNNEKALNVPAISEESYFSIDYSLRKGNEGIDCE
ncbi:hypothetical protein CHS0354_018889 [Potamilus streckersoni]|uniref:Uncharacterized protein n=1 Tax=Potamilus streckersoni TaxID=2493646 RepID=A0AAE0SC52_9BIVA|nr:hypothetical protein CHS0354_018889 [Potamilus streckersoni]